MIPGKILRFLGERANVASAGTRDADLVPHGHRVSCWQVEPDGETLTCFIPSQFTQHVLESLEDNGRLAVTIEEFPSHETYQFKGRYLSHRPADEDDTPLHRRIVDRWAKALRTVFEDLPADTVRAFVPEPSLAVSMTVEEIYLQTPGPGAGTRLVPPGET